MKDVTWNFDQLICTFCKGSNIIDCRPMPMGFLVSWLRPTFAHLPIATLLHKKGGPIEDRLQG